MVKTALVNLILDRPRLAKNLYIPSSSWMSGLTKVCVRTFFNTNNQHCFCFQNLFILYRIRFFHLIWKFAFNRRNQRSKNAATLTSRKLLVSKAGDDKIIQFDYEKKRLEIIFTNRTWHVKLEVSGKLFVYIGVNGIHFKYLKFGCKGFDINQKEATTPKRGSCCQGEKFCSNLGIFSNSHVKNFKTYNNKEKYAS